MLLIGMNKLACIKPDTCSALFYCTYIRCSSEGSVPMITLGLKETKDANFQTVIMVSLQLGHMETMLYDFLRWATFTLPWGLPPSKFRLLPLYVGLLL